MEEDPFQLKVFSFWMLVSPCPGVGGGAAVFRLVGAFREELVVVKDRKSIRGGRQRMRWLIHHQLDGHEFEQALGVGDGQGSLACCSP